MKRKVYFRADGNSSTGLGHVMRSTAFAEMLGIDFDCHFLIRNPSEFLALEIAKVGARVQALTDDLPYPDEALPIAATLSPGDIVVLDGYNYDTAYQAAFKDKGIKVVCVDDICAYPFIADVVINHGPGIPASAYDVAPNTRLCLGPEFALINRDFREAAAAERTVDAAEECLICFGGADFNNITLHMLQIIGDLQLPWRLRVITGNAYKGQESLAAYVDQHPGIVWEHAVTPVQMRQRMRDSEIMICAASTILYEACAVGNGIFSGYYIDNQERIYHGFNILGCITGLGDLNTLTAEKFGELAKGLDAAAINTQIRLQKKIIDGKSGQRLANIISAL